MNICADASARHASITPNQLFFKNFGLKFYCKENGTWECLILDPRLKADIVHKLIDMVKNGKKYPEMKKEIGNWLTRKHITTIEKLLNLALNPIISNQRAQLEYVTMRSFCATN